MTREERHLWFDYLKNYSVKFQAQKVIEDFIVDFYCARAKLIIEVDGEHHYSNSFDVIKDVNRDRRLEQLGYLVVRVSNLDINKNFSGVCETLDSIIKTRVDSNAIPRN